MKPVVLDGASLILPGSIRADAPEINFIPQDEAFEIAKTRLGLALGIARQRFEQEREPAKIVDHLSAELHKIRQQSDPSIWQSLVPIAQSHPVSDFLLQDPFTRWSFEKPRGYSGDAHLLDFIYGHPDVAREIEDSSPLGRAIFAHTRNASSSVAVRERRDLLTKQVDEVATKRGQEAEILTIAAGHLREADRSVALQEGRIKRWVALDQDPLSVGAITRDFSGTRVEAIDGSVRGLLSNAYRLGQFDFIYAAGLYDYLSHKVARALTKACLGMLKPNGRFLFANFAQNIGVDGYMETFMNWELILRSKSEIWDIINESVDRNYVTAGAFLGDNQNIFYGHVEKK